MSQNERQSLLREETQHFIHHSTELKLPRWKGASWLFLENTFERFGYYGIRAVLLLYLRDMLGYDNDSSTIWYHLFTTLTYVWPLILATIADSGLGKYKMIAIAISVKGQQSLFKSIKIGTSNLIMLYIQIKSTSL